MHSPGTRNPDCADTALEKDYMESDLHDKQAQQYHEATSETGPVLRRRRGSALVKALDLKPATARREERCPDQGDKSSSKVYKALSVFLLGALLALYVQKCYWQNRVWINGVTLWGNAVRVQPNAVLPLGEYALALFGAEPPQYRESVRYFHEALLKRPHYGPHAFGLVRAYRALGKCGEVLPYLEVRRPLTG